MLKKNKVKFLAVIFLAITAVPLLINGCSVGNSAEEVKQLQPVEVKEYQGEKLSSVSEFRDNSIQGPMHVDINNYQLTIFGLVQNPQKLSYEDVISRNTLYKKVVTLNCVEGWSLDILWEGPLVKDLIQQAGPLENAKVVIFYAYDGYSTSLPLDYVMNNDIIMAYKMNDITIPPERGFPFQLVAESRWGYKWIKWITEIQLSDDVNYRGYWESRGYSNEGDLNKSFSD
jgi:DMSO/TMAO reductase YedYZ molybdopterin-dependent catalytic subunit